MSARSDNLVGLDGEPLIYHRTGGRWRAWVLTKHLKNAGPGKTHDQRTHGRRGKNKAGLAHAAKFKGPDFLVDGVEKWMGSEAAGWQDPFPRTDFQSVRQDHTRQMEIAGAYEKLPLRQEAALPSFRAMARDVDAQYRFLTNTLGVRMEVTDSDPYPNVQAMVRDVRDNKRLAVLSTASTGGHPFFSNETNDRFRFVHDAFGHAATGRGFDRHGEEAAWMSHVRMFSPQARAAMTSETRGQNAYLIKHGTFPEQKTAILPERMNKHLKGKKNGKGHNQKSHGRRKKGPSTAGGGVPASPDFSKLAQDHRNRQDRRLDQQLATKGVPGETDPVKRWLPAINPWVDIPSNRDVNGQRLVGALKEYDGMWLLEPDIDSGGGLGSMLARATASLRAWQERDGGRNARERSYLLGPNGELVAHMLGTNNQAPTTPTGRGIWDGFTVIHNHPSNGSLSIQDAQALSHMRFKQIVAVTPDSIFRLGLKFPISWKEVSRRVHPHMKPLHERYQAEVTNGRMSVPEAQRRIGHEGWQAAVAANPSIWDYSWSEHGARGSFKKAGVGDEEVPEEFQELVTSSTGAMLLDDHLMWEVYKLEEPVTKHRPGGKDHNQKNHGRKGGKKLKREIDTAGGFTYQPLLDSSPEGGFAVALIPSAEEIFDGTPDAGQVRDFIERNRNRTQNQRVHLGGWYDAENDKTYLDISVVVPDEGLAHRIAAKTDQIAIFDLNNFTEIQTDKDRVREPSGFERSGVGKRGREEDTGAVSGAPGRAGPGGSGGRPGGSALAITEIDEERRQVFGWASVTKIGDVEVVDAQGDAVDIEEVEKAAYDFVLKSRQGGDTHVRVGVSEMIESMVFTPEKIAKLGLDPAGVPLGWWVGFHVTDDKVWEGIKKGRYRAFSIGGSAMRLPEITQEDVAKAKGQVKVKQYTRGGEKVKAHTRGGGSSSGGGMPEGAIFAPHGMGAFSEPVQQAIGKTVAKRQREEGVDLSPATLVGRLTSLWTASHRDDPIGHRRSMAWYGDANKFGQGLAEIHGIPQDRAMGIIAALSPQTAWGPNKEMSHSLIALLKADPKVHGGRRLSDMSPEQVGRTLQSLAHPYDRVSQGDRKGLPANLFGQSSDFLSRGVRLFRGESPDTVLGNGPKIRSFYNNLSFPDRSTSWTDDTHMRRIWLNDPKISNQSNKFNRIFGTAPALKREGYTQGWGTYPYYADIGSATAQALGVMPHQVQAVTWTKWRMQHGDSRDSDAMRPLLSTSDLVGSLQQDTSSAL